MGPVAEGFTIIFLLIMVFILGLVLDCSVAVVVVEVV